MKKMITTRDNLLLFELFWVRVNLFLAREGNEILRRQLKAFIGSVNVKIIHFCQNI